MSFGNFLRATLGPFFGLNENDKNAGSSVKTPDNKTPSIGNFAKPVKWTSAGGVVVHSLTMEGLRKVLLISPKGSYGGYSWTFPKGRVDEGESLIKTAKREVKEESGLEASILPGGYLGVEEGTSSFTHYYMMVRTGGQEGVGTDGESAKVEWVSWSDAFSRMKSSPRDKTILLRAWDHVRKLKRKLD